MNSVIFAANSIVATDTQQKAAPPKDLQVAEGHAPARVQTGDTEKVLQARNSTGTALVFTARRPGAGRGRGGRAGGRRRAHGFGVLSLDRRPGTTTIDGSAPAFSRDGASLACHRATKATRCA